MSVNVKVVQCLGLPLDWLTLLKMATVKDAEGNFYLNLFHNDTECEDLTPALECISNVTFEELFRNLIVEDACELPALSVTGNICDECS